MPYKLKEGITVWKKGETKHGSPCLIELWLPKGTLCRFNPRRPLRGWIKNRCDRARVVSILSLYTHREIKRADGKFYPFPYRVGTWVRPEMPFDKSSNLCASGIHFFTDKEAARAY